MKKIAIALLVIVVLAAASVGGYVWYAKSHEKPRLSLSDRKQQRDTAAPAAPASFDGTWKVSAGSEAGYNVVEDLRGVADITAQGRSTGGVSGSIVIDGPRVTSGSFSVKVDTIGSDESFRDQKFRGQIMDSSTFPTADFVLTAPIELGSIPADDQEITATATGTLTLKGRSRSVTVPVKAVRKGGEIDINGTIPVTFSDFGIANPSNPVAKVRDRGDVEFLLVLKQG
jgi:polyisoprenoid-binding protein YceI